MGIEPKSEVWEGLNAGRLEMKNRRCCYNVNKTRARSMRSTSK